MIHPRFRVPLVAAVLAAGLPVGGCGEGGTPEEVRREAPLMGTSLAVRVVADDPEAADRAAEAVFDGVSALESRISSWDSTTDLGRLNRAPVGEPVEVHPELLALLVRADSLAEATGRAFEPAVGPLVDAWGVRTGGRQPDSGEVERALEAVRAGFRFDTAAGTATRLHPHVWIDTGGFGKGAALAVAGRALREAGARSALVDFGGQALTLGERPGGGPWRIGVAHPARRDEPTLALHLGPDLSVATSGGSERPGHILDPRTGRRIPSWGSVTVVSPDPVVADALATALFVVGADEAVRRAESLHVGVLVLDEAGAAGDRGPRARWNRPMTRWLDTTALGGAGAGTGG